MLTLSPSDPLFPVPKAIEKATGYRPHPTTCTRWTRKGVSGVKLATVMVGGRPKTTVGAVLHFIEKRSVAQAERQERETRVANEASDAAPVTDAA